jgi:hypothetical protein
MSITTLLERLAEEVYYEQIKRLIGKQHDEIQATIKKNNNQSIQDQFQIAYYLLMQCKVYNNRQAAKRSKLTCSKPI